VADNSGFYPVAEKFGGGAVILVGLAIATTEGSRQKPGVPLTHNGAFLIGVAVFVIGVAIFVWGLVGQARKKPVPPSPTHTAFSIQNSPGLRVNNPQIAMGDQGKVVFSGHITNRPEGSEIQFATIVPPGQPIIAGQNFTDKLIVGPAVVFLTGTTSFDNCRWEVDDPDALFLPVDRSRTVFGVIALDCCSFVRCEFKRIGVVVAADELDDLRAKFGLPPSPPPG